MRKAIPSPSASRRGFLSPTSNHEKRMSLPCPRLRKGGLRGFSGAVRKNKITRRDEPLPQTWVMEGVSKCHAAHDISWPVPGQQNPSSAHRKRVLAAFTSRSQLSPQVQTCCRSLKVFFTTFPQRLHRCVGFSVRVHYHPNQRLWGEHWRTSW